MGILVEYQKQVDNSKMNLQDLNRFIQKLQLASTQKKLYITFRLSKDLEDILIILQRAHLISGYTKNLPDTLVKIFLAYDIQGSCIIKEIKVVSTLKQRLIINTKQVKAYLNDYPYSVALIRTCKGILNIKTCRDLRIGGEFLAYVK